MEKEETAMPPHRRLEKAKITREFQKLQESPTPRGSYRLDKQRQTTEKRRCASRFEDMDQITEKRRRGESPTSRASRLERQRQKYVESRRDESPASRTDRLEKLRQRRLNESPTSRASRLEKQRLRAEKRRREFRFEKRRQINAERRCDDSPISQASQLATDSFSDEARLLDESPISSGILDSKGGNNDVRRSNISETSIDYSNNDASVIKSEYIINLKDKEDYSKSTLTGENKPKASSTNLISNVECNAAIENLSDSNLCISNITFDFDVNPSEPFGIYQCCLCPLNFADKKDLSKHLLKHFDRRRPYMCQVCESTFSLKNSLKTHINNWADIRPYQCEQCDEAFTTSSKLCHHERTNHSNMSPYKCAKCDYKTFYRNNLNTHMAVHKDDRPFKCNYCSYASKTQTYLTSHEMIHKDGKQCKCDICYSRFAEPQELRDHRKTHFVKGLLVHRCSFCLLTLGSPNALRNHVHRVHREI